MRKRLSASRHSLYGYMLFFLLISYCGLRAQDRKIEIAGWYNDGWDTESHAVYMSNHTLFSEVNPYWYNLGSSDAAPGKSATNGSIYERSYAYNASEVTAAHGNGDLVIPTIGDMAAGQINTIFSNSTSRANLIRNLLTTAQTRGYDGWDLNFELGNEAGKALYTAFVNDLADTLAAHGKVLDITIGAFEDSTKESYWIFDIGGLKTCHARRIKIMAYDQNISGSDPGAVADINWVQDVLNYMVVSRGLPAKKVLLGIPNYGWTYKETSTGVYTLQYPFEPYTYITAQTGITSWWNSYLQEMYAEWTSGGSNYMAFYSNAASVSARLALVGTYGLAGAAFWVLGREDTAIYSTMRTQFPSANVAPTVSLSAPTSGSSYAAPATVTISATATDSDGRIEKVDFYDGTTYLGTDTSSPYSYSWTYVPNGTHVLKAIAYDNVGDYTSSATRTITVTGATPWGGVPWNIPGKIESEYYDLGGEGVAYHDLTTGNSGDSLRSDGVDIEGCSDTGGGYNIAYFATGEWMEYIVKVTAGTYTIKARVGASATGGKLKITLDDTVLGSTVNVPNTGGYQVWQDLTVGSATLTAGGWRKLKVYASTGGFNINYVTFTSSSGSSISGVPLSVVPDGEAIDNNAGGLRVLVYPNPARDQVTLSLQLPVGGQTKTVLSDINGKVLSVLQDGYLAAGAHTLFVSTASMAPGIYIYTIKQGGSILSGKIIRQ